MVGRDKRRRVAAEGLKDGSVMQIPLWSDWLGLRRLKRHVWLRKKHS